MPGTDYPNLSRAQLLEVIRELKGILSERRSQPFARPGAFGPSKLESALSEQEARRGAWQRVVPHPQLLAAIVEASADAITSRTLDGTLLTWNKGAEKVYGYAAGEAIGRNYLMLFPEASEAEVAEINARLLRGESIFDMESVRKRKDGSLVHVSMNVAPLFEKGRVVRICSIARDITARKDAEQQIRRMAHFDPLTGLPNRILLIDRLEQALAVSQRNHSRTGVMFLDLDHFKDVNDRLGHHIGDQLLQQVAGRVQDSIREVDTVSRVGGDEFILVLPELRRPDDLLLGAVEEIESALEAARVRRERRRYERRRLEPGFRRLDGDRGDRSGHGVVNVVADAGAIGGQAGQDRDERGARDRRRARRVVIDRPCRSQGRELGHRNRTSEGGEVARRHRFDRDQDLRRRGAHRLRLGLASGGPQHGEERDAA